MTGLATVQANDRAGHALSALAFIAMTALWAYIVRNDPYYSSVTVFGVTLPVKTAGYLTVLPLVGFIVGRWRYRAAPRRAALPSLAAGVAGILHFLYSHILIVLFTAAVAVRTFLGWDMDAAVRSIDDRLFDIAARFAPWVSAYLAGFSIGRLFGGRALAAAAAEEVRTSDRRQSAVDSNVASDRYDRVRVERPEEKEQEPQRKKSARKRPPGDAVDPKNYRPRYSRLR